MKPPKKAKASGAPAKGHKWKYMTDSPIPNPEIVPAKKAAKKLKPMRTIASGTYGSGKVKRTEKRGGF